jgi:hypothetical protein
MELLHRWYCNKTDWVSHLVAYRSHCAALVSIPAPWECSQGAQGRRPGNEFASP